MVFRFLFQSEIKNCTLNLVYHGMFGISMFDIWTFKGFEHKKVSFEWTMLKTVETSLDFLRDTENLKSYGNGTIVYNFKKGKKASTKSEK